MKELEIEKKMTELVKKNEKLIENAKEDVESVVAEELGGGWTVEGFTHRGFRVQLKRENGASVFGCYFDIIVTSNWQYDKDRNFVSIPTVQASTGTCGSFDIGKDDDQEKKYIAFAKFLSECNKWLRNVILRTYIKFEKNCNEYRRLDYELTGRKEQ